MGIFAILIFMIPLVLLSCIAEWCMDIPRKLRERRQDRMMRYAMKMRYEGGRLNGGC